MTPRERFLASANHKEPDKIPVDLASTTVTSISVTAYRRLMDYLGFHAFAEPVISHIHQGIVYPGEEILKRYEVDFRTFGMKKSPRGFVVRELPDKSFYDEYGMLWKKLEHDYGPASSPWADFTIGDLDKAVWPDPYESGRVAGLREKAARLREDTDYAIVADIMCRGPFESAVKLRGYENFLTDLVLDTKYAEAVLDKITENTIGLWDVYLDAAGEYADVVCQGDDIGTQIALMISPEMYRRFIKPCHKRIFDFVRSKTKAKVFMHSCGSIYDIIPDLIEIGVDILNPIQRYAANMGIEKLKNEFGKDLCFWGGGLDVQQFLPNATLAEIEDEVKRTLEIMSKDGGFIFAFTHNVHVDVTPEKLDHAYRSVLKYR